MKKQIIEAIIILMLAAGAASPALAGVIEPELQTALDAIGPDDEVNVLVTLVDQVDVKKVKDKNKDMPKSVLRATLIAELKDKKDKTQKAVKDLLKGKATKITSFWIFNGLAVTATRDVILDLAALAEVESIRLDGTIVWTNAAPGAAGGTAEWNLDAIGASQMWDLGFRGAGVVVADAGTGVDALHQELGPRWRGGSNSWYDPNGEHASPYDYDGHGTQVMGLMVGGDADGTSIGVAPDASWIAVKIFNDAGMAEYSDIHLGFQWLLDPDDNAGTDDSPDVVNNSWGYGQLVDVCFTEFQADIQALKAAEIAVVFSAGNQGPDFYTSESPANYPESFAAGAVDDTLRIARLSGRGPSACDGAVYPELVAPGVAVKTAGLTYGGTVTDNYTFAAGTSFAAPHVAGALALLTGAFPGAAVADLESALKDAAADLGEAGADDTHGYGLLDAFAAYSLLSGRGAPPCTDADGDGFFAEIGCGTAVDCVDADGAINPGACDITGDGIDQDCDGADRTKGKPCPTAGVDDGGDTGDTGGSEGKWDTCSDGLDNDGDGLSDCADPDCSKNKACR